MAQASTLAALPLEGPAHATVKGIVRTYSFGFAAVLAIGLLLANIFTVSGGFGVLIWARVSTPPSKTMAMRAKDADRSDRMAIP